MNALSWIKVLAFPVMMLGLHSCSGPTTPVGKPGPGAPATLTFDNPSVGEELVKGMMWGAKKSSLLAPKVDGVQITRFGTYGRWSVPVHSGSHSLGAILTAGQGTDAIRTGLRMHFDALPNRSYVLQALSYRREGHHRVTLLEDGRPIRQEIVPYDSHQSMDPVMMPLPVR